jgi:hypothetical protein
MNLHAHVQTQVYRQSTPIGREAAAGECTHDVSVVACIVGLQVRDFYPIYQI